MANKTVIKLNNIPHGFYEEQMKEYFSQFGKVKNVVLIRSSKTHKSRGFGFIEFALAEVARAAAEAMHNYLFFNSVLKCRQMKKTDLPKGLLSKKYPRLTSVELNKRRQNVTSRDMKKIRNDYKRLLRIQSMLKNKFGVNVKCHVINKPDVE